MARANAETVEIEGPRSVWAVGDDHGGERKTAMVTRKNSPHAYGHGRWHPGKRCGSLSFRNDWRDHALLLARRDWKVYEQVERLSYGALARHSGK